MAYDAADHEVVLVGAECSSGFSSNRPFPNNWTWVFANNSWTPHAYPSSAGAYCGAGLVWDARDGYLVLFGGTTGPSQYVTNNETYTFVRGNWTLLALHRSPTSNPPSPYFSGTLFSMTYDASAGYVLLYQGATLTFRATWKFTGGVWTQLSIPVGHRGPLTSTYHLLAYDSTDGYAVLFSHYGGATSSTTWKFANGSWSNLTNPSRPGPTFVQGDGLLQDDPALGAVVLVGYSSATPSTQNQFWAFAKGNWSNLTLGAAAPGARVSAVAYDPTTSRLLVHPDDPYNYGLSSSSGYSSTWAIVRGNWTPVRDVTTGGPAAREAAGLVSWGAYGVVLFGGCGAGRAVFSDTWSFVGGFWTNISSRVGTPPSARCGMAMLPYYDPVLKVQGILLFGGTDRTHVFSDTWFFDGSWQRITSLGHAPPPRYDAAMVYDQRDARYVLFGGRNLTSYLGDTWYIRAVFGTWTQGKPVNAPSARAGALLEFQIDTLNTGYLTLFGGHNSSGFLNDTWQFYNGNWTPDGGPWPGPLPFANVIAYACDCTHGSLIEFGGSGTPGATWFYEYDRWYQFPNVTGPPPRLDSTIANAQYSPYFIVFGGASRTGLLGDTWELIPNPR